jgi:aryl-alcohol dehydrogenase-like predicted oxidoreductase
VEKRKLGYTDLHFTTIGLGTFAIGGPWEWGWGPQDDDDSIVTIQRALDLGINWIDAAPAYGLGHAEEIVGRAIKGRRDEVIVATKVGQAWDDPSERKTINRIKAWSVRQEIEDSLRRLDVDVIDLYQVHWPIPDEDIEEAWTEIAKIAEEGKVRYAGVSNFNVEQMERVMSIHPIASLQPPYNMLERDIEEAILPFCLENNIGVVGYGPMAAGLLTGKFTPEKIAALPPGDWRHKRGDYQEPELSVNLGFVNKLKPIAERHDCSLAQLAVAWTLHHPAMTSSIVGARRPEQIEETVKAADVKLSKEDMDEIDGLLAERAAALEKVAS